MSDPAGLRVSDQQRDDAARQLRDHFAAGRLTHEELDERLQASYAARTEDDLRRLLADLPALPVSPQERKAELVERRRHLQRRLIQQTGGSLSVFMICVFVWLASGATGGFWPIWVAIFPGVTLLRNTWRLYGPSPELDRVERELERRGRRHEGRDGHQGRPDGRRRRRHRRL